VHSLRSRPQVGGQIDPRRSGVIRRSYGRGSDRLATACFYGVAMMEPVAGTMAKPIPMRSLDMEDAPVTWPARTGE
jgi:hypothetical protein